MLPQWLSKREDLPRVPWFDLLTAAIGLRVRVRIYSIDKHFAAMQEHLGLPLYEPGYGGKFAPE